MKQCVFQSNHHRLCHLLDFEPNEGNKETGKNLQKEVGEFLISSSLLYAFFFLPIECVIITAGLSEVTLDVSMMACSLEKYLSLTCKL
jgi:hypothetical protein